MKNDARKRRFNIDGKTGKIRIIKKIKWNEKHSEETDKKKR